MEADLTRRQQLAWCFGALGVPAMLLCAAAAWQWVLLAGALAALYYIIVWRLWVRAGQKPLPVLVRDAFGGAGRGIEVACDVKGDTYTGRGETLDAALDELCASAPGTLFLQTAEHILITPDARHILPEAVVSRRLRPAARVYYLQGGTPELSRAGDFLRAHGGGARLTDVRARLLGAEGAPEIATLVCAQGRMRLYGG